MTKTIQIPDGGGFYLEAPLVKDADFLRSIVRDPAIMETQGGVLGHEQVEIFVRYVFDHWETNGYGHYILRSPGGLPAGAISLKKLTAEGGEESADLGFMILPAFRGRGLATRAARALINHGFQVLGLQRISSMAFAQNAPAKSVLEKLGFARKKVTSLKYMGRTFEGCVYWERRRVDRGSLPG